MDSRIRLIHPTGDFDRALLIGFPDRLLGSIAPPGEILADGANGHLEAELQLDQLPDRLAVPEGKGQLQLIRVMIDDRLLDLLFLLSREVPFFTMLPLLGFGSS